VRLGIDLSAALRPGTGAELYARPLAEHLASALRSPGEIVGFVNGRTARRSPLLAVPTFNPRWSSRILSHFWRRGVWGVERFVGDVDAFIGNDWLCPPRLRNGPLVIVVFDLVFERHPELVTAAVRNHMREQARLWAARASGLIAISDSTRRDLESCLGERCPPVRVVYPGLDPALAQRSAPEEGAAVRRRHGLTQEYLLYLGTHAPRKNLPRLLRAYALARRAGLKAPLLLVGGREPSSALAPSGDDTAHVLTEVRRLGLETAVRVCGHVPRAEVRDLLRGAKFLVFPSLYEGFGFPVLEAMAAGVPVLTSRASSLPEVCGDAALYVDPQDEGELTAALGQLDSDEALRVSLARRGPLRAARFSWAEAAAGTLRFVGECQERNR